MVLVLYFKNYSWLVLPEVVIIYEIIRFLALFKCSSSSTELSTMQLKDDSIVKYSGIDYHRITLMAYEKKLL